MKNDKEQNLGKDYMDERKEEGREGEWSLQILGLLTISIPVSTSLVR